MMKTKFFYVAALIAGLSFTATSCNSDDDPEVNPADIDYTSENASSWHNYMRNAAILLKTDATNLYNAWNSSYNGGVSYAEFFKAHNTAPYTSALNCVEEIVDKCAEIANEVGTAKMGDPYNLYKAGNTEEALYAVESWYSWHSRDDYTNNIYSIRNAYYGSLDGKINANSLSKVIAGVNATLDTKIKNAITAAAEAIQGITQPFRNHIASNETVVAMDACADLELLLKNDLKSYIANNSAINSDAVLDPVVKQYVDGVVVPTYKSLKEKNEALYDAVVALAEHPSNDAFTVACKAWMTAREPWEKSEAFLFGPVDEMGLDPNMDSWPLDQNAIVQILYSQSWSDMEWGPDDSDEAVESAQNVRGFHTLEFLLYKDGEPRKVQ